METPSVFFAFKLYSFIFFKQDFAIIVIVTLYQPDRNIMQFSLSIATYAVMSCRINQSLHQACIKKPGLIQFEIV